MKYSEDRLEVSYLEMEHVLEVTPAPYYPFVLLCFQPRVCVRTSGHFRNFCDVRARSRSRSPEQSPAPAHDSAPDAALDTRRYPACHNRNCGKQRCREEGPWNPTNTAHYYCSDNCRYPRCIGQGGKTCAAERTLLDGVRLRYDQKPEWRCRACEKLTMPLLCEAGCGVTKPIEAFDTDNVKNWRKGNCRLRCSECRRDDKYCWRQSCITVQLQKCAECSQRQAYCLQAGCKAKLPRSHFHKTDLNNAQQRLKKNPSKSVHLQCRQ